MVRRRCALMLLAGFVAVTACGGDDDDAANPFDGIGDAGGAEDTADAGGVDDASGSASRLGDVALEADPLSAWMEVDGDRFEYPASGTISFECNIAPENVRVNIQTAEDFFTLNGIINQGAWLFTLTVSPPGDSNVAYGGTPLTTTGSVGLDATAMSYVGDVDKVTDFDIANAESVPAEFAVNCEPPGPDPSAEIGDAVFTAPFNGAASIRCEVTDDVVDIRVQQQVPSRVQISIDATSDGTNWLGNSAVNADDGDFSSTIPADGSGLTIDGQTVTYEGLFTTPGGEAEGEVIVTCP